jgi:hypothetical protein
MSRVTTPDRVPRPGWMAVHRKALIAAAGALLTVLAATLPPDTTAWTVVSAVLAAATAAGVFGVGNAQPPGPEHRA